MISVNIQSSIRIEGSKTLYFDPIKINEGNADIILITHTHYDHFEKESILNIKNDSTIIIGPSDIKYKCLAMGFDEKNIIIMNPNEQATIDGIEIKTVPAYNISKQFHKKEYNWLGYIVKMDEVSYYIAGDTDVLDENKNIKVDVAFVPIGGLYTMDWKEACNYINEIKPKKVVPIHYGMVVGSREDFIKFKDSVKDVEVLELLK